MIFSRRSPGVERTMVARMIRRIRTIRSSGCPSFRRKASARSAPMISFFGYATENPVSWNTAAMSRSVFFFWTHAFYVGQIARPGIHVERMSDVVVRVVVDGGDKSESVGSGLREDFAFRHEGFFESFLGYPISRILLFRSRLRNLFLTRRFFLLPFPCFSLKQAKNDDPKPE
jgi:hypothetical protein